MNKCLGAPTFLCLSFLNAVYFCSADSLTTVNLVWGAKPVPMGFHSGWWCWLCPACQGWERMREQSHRCWNGGGGGHVRCFSPRGLFGVELGPNLNWPYMMGLQSHSNQRWQIFQLNYDWSVKMDTGFIDGQIDKLKDPMARLWMWQW